MSLDNSTWITKLAKEYLSKKADHQIDESLNTLQELLDQGFDKVQLMVPETACEKCQSADKSVKDLSSHLNSLQHDAPIFECTHPDDGSCYLKVWKSSDPDSIKAVYKNGDFEDL